MCVYVCVCARVLLGGVCVCMSSSMYDGIGACSAQREDIVVGVSRSDGIGAGVDHLSDMSSDAGVA